MRIAITATAVTTMGLLATVGLGVAGAETVTTPTVPPSVTPPPVSAPVRSVSVQGVATEPIDQSANAATATAVYRQGMSDAIGDGLAKAQFLVGKTGASLGQVLSIVEGGGYISCQGNNEYLGEQPDIGSAPVSVAGNSVSPRSAAGRVAPSVPTPTVRRRKRRKHPPAKRSAVVSCTLSAQVSLVYALS